MRKTRWMAGLLIAAAGAWCLHGYAADGDPKAPADKKAKQEARKARQAAKASDAAKADANAAAAPKAADPNAPAPRPYGVGPRGELRITRGSLEDNLGLLGSFKKPPEFQFKLYEAAYKALAAKPDATFMDVADDPDVQRICKDNGVVALGGPMLGCVTADGASVWVRAAKPAQVEVRVAVGGAVKTFGPAAATAETDLSAVVKVTGLAPNTKYAYRVLVDGKEVEMPQGATLITAPKSDEPGKARVVFGSCFHRFGLGNDMQADLIVGRKPTAALFIGDIAVQDREENLNMHRADYLLRDFRPAWRTIAASVPVLATWDDHDYFNNDKSGIPKPRTDRAGNTKVYTDAERRGVRKVFAQSWANPSYGFGDEGGGVFNRWRVGPCDIVMLDNRYFREHEKGSFLGAEQMKWLKEQLLSCKGPFIILSCGTMWSDYITPGKDSWGVWDPDGREELFTFIEDNRIGGVLLISGDRHGARGFTIPRPSGFKFYEFEGGSLGGWEGPPTKGNDPANQLYGISNRYAFSEFTFDATASDPAVEFRLIGDDGEVIYETRLTRSQLTPRGK